MKKITNCICGLILIPLLYKRYTFILFLPIFFITNIPTGVIIIMWLIYTLLFNFIMSNCGIMKYWTMLFEWLFNVQYSIVGYWTSNIHHSSTVWEYPILKVKDKKYELSIPISGGDSYEKEAAIRRKAIICWLLK